MTIKSYSYKEALTYRLFHKEGIHKINKIIEESQTRYSMSKYNEDDNDSPKWCYGIGDKKKSLQFQCMNCIICGGYIERMSYPKNLDPYRLIKNIYCNNNNHHNITNKKNDILNIKILLKNFDVSKHKHYLYHASIREIMIKDHRLNIFYDIFIAYVGTSRHVH